MRIKRKAEDAEEPGQGFLRALLRPVERRALWVCTDDNNPLSVARPHASEKFRVTYPPLKRATEGIDRFLAVAAQIGIWPAQGKYDVYAPHGLDDLSTLTMRPNLCLIFRHIF